MGLIKRVYKKIPMYTSENPHFNTIDKIILSLIGFSMIFIILKAFLDYVDGYGPFGWRWEGMVKEIENSKRRQKTHTHTGQLRRRRVYISNNSYYTRDSKNNIN